MLVNNMTVTKVTLDTNTVDDSNLIKSGRLHGFEFVAITVTDRELQPSDIRADSEAVGTVPETVVLDESCFGQAVLGSDSDRDMFEEFLVIISNGSFPKVGQRENLTQGQRRQLRDAMILSAHIREGRDIFVTNDIRGFISDNRRKQIEERFNTKIMTSVEFLNLCNGKSRR